MTQNTRDLTTLDEPGDEQLTQFHPDEGEPGQGQRPQFSPVAQPTMTNEAVWYHTTRTGPGKERPREATTGMFSRLHQDQAQQGKGTGERRRRRRG